MGGNGFRRKHFYVIPDQVFSLEFTESKEGTPNSDRPQRGHFGVQGPPGGTGPAGPADYHNWRSRLRYWTASARWAGPMRSAPARSATVRATFKMRS